MMFFNERSRGLPSGIILGQTNSPTMSLDTDFSTAKLFYKEPSQQEFSVSKVEVSSKVHLILLLLARAIGDFDNKFRLKTIARNSSLDLHLWMFFHYISVIRRVLTVSRY